MCSRRAADPSAGAAAALGRGLPVRVDAGAVLVFLAGVGGAVRASEPARPHRLEKG